MNRKPSYYVLATLFIIGLAVVVSCNKGDDTLPVVSANARVNVINTTGQTINYYVSGTRQNNTGGIVPGGATGYTNLPEGDQQLLFKYAFNKNNLSSIDTLFSLPIRLDNAAYSVFVTSTSRNGVIATRDTVASSADTIPSVRFIHASSNLPALRVELNDTVRFANVAYKSVSSFKKLTRGIKIIRIYTATGTSPLYSLTQTLSRGKYTLFVQGALNATRTDDAIKAILLSN
ncbi:DUF4397 domain-containing protein [Mucilaginibacter lacusdianchii]|uniref:DUF4397 domain-containing protein n=1 Tax=Mucilaginibacter lacusdianchii TaxID=2684211 RepID=UPI00131CC3D2|nr:DUF4397 domain-containing protein [Mucilaginibacter sp. JXJ CY 39]